MIQRVAIVGVGLIGASFGLALRKAAFAGSIVGVSSPRSIAAALERGAIDSGMSLEDAAPQSDLIFLSQPISGIIATLAQLDPLVRPSTTVTDAGSTKVEIVNAAGSSLRNCPFVGGHPMAGKAQRGAEEADADLFQGRPWILTSYSDHPVEVEFRGWLEKFGARILVKDAATHDRLVAWSSHLPQLASTALAASLHDSQPLAADVAGPGLLDMTRLAMSSYDLWRDILETNQTEVASALDAYIARLQAIRAACGAANSGCSRLSGGSDETSLEDEFARGADFAQHLRRPTLHSQLNHTPKELQFGTSGRRGLIVDLTQLEIYINVTGELEYLQSLPPEDGGIRKGDDFYYALDLRPSSPALCEAVERALADAGMRGVNLGQIPTPALMYYALGKGRASIMVTGSHIPFDRNGYKLNTSRGELLKQHEAPIGANVAKVRECIYAQPFDESIFDATGTLREHRELSPAQDAAREACTARYLDFFSGQPASLAGRRILVYQHSAVGRDLLADLLTRLGAEVIPAGRSDTFVPIDTENIDTAQLETIQKLADEHKGLWAVVSTDGDSDRPLVLSLPPVKFHPGDLVGFIVAEYLHADAVVVPISCNDAIDRSTLADVLEPKTRIGSPYVIAGMQTAIAKGRRAVCGWEANGGFLLGSDITRNGRKLTALPTRDALLPILGVLFAAAERNISIGQLFAELPKRFSKAGLLKNFHRESGLAIVQRLTPSHTNDPDEHARIATDLARVFTPARGFKSVARLNYTDGVRIIFSNNDVAHIRPSGNADELRIYAAADTQARADAIVAEGIREPDGILRSLQRLISG